MAARLTWPFFRHPVTAGLQYLNSVVSNKMKKEDEFSFGVTIPRHFGQFSLILLIFKLEW